MDGTLEIQAGPGVAVLVLRGAHDRSTQAQLQAAIDRAVAAGVSVVLDLSAVEFIDSTVLSAILHGHKRATNGDDGREQGLAAVASPGAQFVARMLSLVRVDDHVGVHLSRDSAVVTLRGTGGFTPRVVGAVP